MELRTFLPDAHGASRAARILFQSVAKDQHFSTALRLRREAWRSMRRQPRATAPAIVAPAVSSPAQMRNFGMESISVTNGRSALVDENGAIT